MQCNCIKKPIVSNKYILQQSKLFKLPIHLWKKNQCAKICFFNESKEHLAFRFIIKKMFLTWIRWSSRVGPRGKDPGPRGRDPGPIGGAPNPWGVPNVSIPREIFTGSPLDRIVEQWCTECWDAFNQGFLFPFPVRLLFSKFNCQ